jgi:hypothetical protein
MTKCKGCATYASTFKGDSTRCLLEKSAECVCTTCLIKMICRRKLECMVFCRQALTIHNAHDSGFIRCLKNMFPEMYKELMSEGRITLTKKE